MIKKTVKPIYPSALEIISQAVQIFRLKYQILIQVFLVPSITTTILVSIYSLVFHPQFNTPQDTIRLVFTPEFTLFFILATITNLWSQASLIYTVVHLKDDLIIRNVFSASLRFLPRLFILNLIILLSIIGGSILFFIPGILCGVMFSLGGVILVAESETPLRAILKSSHYVSGYLKAYLIRLVTFGLLSFLVILLLNLGVTLVNNDFSTSIIDFISNLLVTIFSLLFSYLNYLYLKSFRLKLDIFVPGKKQKLAVFVLTTFGLIMVSFLVYVFVANRSLFA